MKVTKYLFFAAITLPLVLASCRGQISEKPPVHPNPNMDQQRRFEPQEENDFFADNRAQRQPVKGTVFRGNLRHDKVLYEGINEDSSFVTEIPVKVTKSFLYRGKDRYDVYCTVCHGIAGDGQGIIMTGGYGYVPAPSFHIDRLREAPYGHFYSAITNGIRNMPSYAQQIPVKDRWAIVAYVRALQESQNATEQEIRSYDVDLASLKEDYMKKQEALAAKEAEAAQQGGGEVSADRGKQIATENACQSCHSIDGSKLVGPTWKNLYGHEVEFEDGSTAMADEAYLHESIVDPAANIVAGFPPSMVPYDFLSDSEINSLIEYIKSLSDAAPPESDTQAEEAESESTEEAENETQSTEPETEEDQEKAATEPAADTTDTTETLSASAQQGKMLFKEFECLSCHTIDGSKDLAPPFKGLFEKEIELEDGTFVTADEGYIKESIQYPGAKITLGYQDNMPSYRDLLSDAQLQSITDYIKSLR
ncbi:MAG TPA: c-type cytochrome [Fodinibius sp.]|nr:c-type cytochrome [Fodinibius sp.]